MRQELAVAILLWKFTRMTNKVAKIAGGKWCPEESFDAAMFALKMAKTNGVLDEFMEVLRETPVMSIMVKELEKWDVPPAGKFNPFVNKKV